MLPIEADNQKALAENARSLGRHDWPLKDLQAKPGYWGWVAGSAIKDIDFRMFLGGHDDGVALRWFWNRHYERMALGLWTVLAAQADLVVDIGAHTGVYSLAAWAARPRGGAISFEPHFMNYARLNLNLRSNGFPTRLSAPLAISHQDGMVPFSIHTSLDYLGTGGAVGDQPGAMTFPVQARRLDSHLDSALWPRIAMMKIDTEGHEDDVLAGSAGLIERARPDLLVECTDAAVGTKLTRRLATLGYQFFVIDDRECAVQPAAEIAPALSGGEPVMHLLNRLATRRSPSEVERLAAETRRRLS
jgi:FkbM family methyltransferase